MSGLRYAAYRTALESMYFSGAHRILRPLFGGVGAILTFHRVQPASDAAFQPNEILEVEAGFLERLVQHLRGQGLELVSMDEVHRRLVEQDFSRKFVALTFDDGYVDNLEHAWPVLQRHEVPFALYIATSFPDRLGELWWVALERVIAKVDRVAIEMNRTTRFISCAGTSAKRKAFEDIYWWLRSMSDESELRRAIRDICARYGVDIKGPCNELCMDWAQIGRMAEDPLCTIGAHTINHVFLSKVSAGTARTEMARSAEVIEAALGEKPKHFAYPYGEIHSAGPREYKVASELGFKTAVTTNPSVLQARNRETLTALPRISVNGSFQTMRYVDVLLSGLPFAFRRAVGAAEAA
ncbi:MAG TPA: polysaccharide deacetylase family protein [Xanthobacteraceae bacterium]|nr:polysaccharide deacetylase family protein [Xanthobacteraceae bacterium]